MSFFYYWGPLLYRTKINKEDLNTLLKICKKDKYKDYRSSLAGIIDHEYLIEKEKYNNIINKYFNDFYITFKNWYGYECKKIETTEAWVNFMKSGESNPPHIHTNCNFSSVIYIKIPTQIKEENKKYIGTLKENGGPGSICFFYGEVRDFNLNSIRIFPDEGDFFIFPYNLYHYVVPFKSKVERISIAANFNIY